MGFITYSADVAGTLRNCLRRNTARYVLALATTVLVEPAVIPEIARVSWSVLFSMPEDDADMPAELLTIALETEARGSGPLRTSSGTSVSHELTEDACLHLAQLGAARVKVLCKPGEPIANKFVRNEGFVAAGDVSRYGVKAKLYVKELAR
ncbi:MAG: hypothetical protein ACT4OZ_02360 [Gemmatimonadota bacterium]